MVLMGRSPARSLLIYMLHTIAMLGTKRGGGGLSSKGAIAWMLVSETSERK